MYYKPEAKNFEAFIQRITTDYLKYGYFYIKAGSVPVETPLQQFDRGMVQKFNITYRHRHGSKDVQYVRFGSYYLLVARRKETLTSQGIKGVIDIRENYITLNQWRMRIKKNALLVENGEKVESYRLKPIHGFKDYYGK
jgi:hypothetical protein